MLYREKSDKTNEIAGELVVRRRTHTMTVLLDKYSKDYKTFTQLI